MNAPRQIPPEMKKLIIWQQAIAPVAIIAVLWILLAARALFGFDLIAWALGKAVSSSLFYSFMAVIGTIACGIWCAFQVDKALHLAKNGVEVTGKIDSISPLSAHQMVPVRYSYEYEGHSYDKAVDLYKGDVEKLTVGGPFRLLVDPREPEVSSPYDEVFPKVRTSENDRITTENGE